MLRLLNVAFGAWLVVAPLVVEGGSGWYAMSSIAGGAAVVALSLPRGPIRERYGTLDRLIR